MRLPFTLLLALFALSSPFAWSQTGSDCVPTALLPLEGNAVSALISNGGDLWYDGNENHYRVTSPPDSSGATHTFQNFFAGGLWLGGVAPNGGVKVAAQKYERGGGGFDYAPGPLTVNGTRVDNCGDWDKLFPITRIEVDAARQLFSGLPIDTAMLPVGVLGWPALGNPYFEAVHGFALPDVINRQDPNTGTLIPLAPFFDADEDGRYNPTLGDYPAFCGDQAIWTVFNDARQHRASGTPRSIQAEVRLLAYSFTADEGALNTSTFYRYEVTNRGQETLDDFYMGLYLSSDLGCYFNDFTGTMPDRNLLYYYNETPTEEIMCGNRVASTLATSPAVIVQVLDGEGDKADELPTDNLYACTNMYGNHDGPPAMYPPSRDTEYHLKLRGRWLDGRPVYRDGSFGFNTLENGDSTRFHFDGLPTPDSTPWKQCTEFDVGLISEQVFSVGPYRMQPGQSASFMVGITTIFDLPYSGSCPDTEPIIAAAERIKEVYNNGCTPSILSATDSPAAAGEVALSVYPNPAQRRLNFRAERGNSLQAVTLFSVDGRRVLTRSLTSASGSVELAGNGLAAGVYVYRVNTLRGVVTGRVVVQ